MIHAILKTLIFALLLCSIPGAAQDARAEGHPYRIICDIWPPYQIQDGNTVSGFSADVVRAVFDRLDEKTGKIDHYPWKRALSDFKAGHADAIFSANYTKARLEYARYPAETLLDTPWIIWSHQSQAITSLADLKGKTIGVVDGYSYTPAFWEFIRKHCRVEAANSDESNFRKLELGRLDAIVAEYGNGSYLVSELGRTAIVAHPEITIKKDGLYIMFNKKIVTERFVETFSNELKAFKKSDEYKRLYQTYFSTDHVFSFAPVQ